MMTTLMLSENMALAARSRVERMTGIEPALSAWELDCHTCSDHKLPGQHHHLPVPPLSALPHRLPLDRARDGHARHTHELPAYAPIPRPPPEHAACADPRGHHAPVEDGLREVKMPNYEHDEHRYNRGGQAAKTCHHSRILPVREPVEPSIHRHPGPSGASGRVRPAPTRSSIPAECCHMLDGFCQVAA